MAIDPEELKRRRQERARQRQAKNRRMMIRLIAAAAVLLVCLLGVFLLSRGNRNSGETSAATPETTNPVQTSDIPETTAPATTVIHVAAAGDLNITDKVVAAGGEDYDYTQAFLDVAHLMGGADISVLNFEGNLVGSPYGSSYTSAPQSLMEALDAAGVDLIQLANSYSIKNGMSGLSSTIDAVRAAGMEPLGVYANQESYEQSGGYTIVTAQGIKVAFVAFTKGMDGMTLPPGNEDCVNLLYSDYDSTYQQVNTEKINRVLDAVDKENPDAVIVLVHWGSEFNDTVSASQEKICKLLQSRGVDAIIGTHSHYVQQMVYNELTGSFIAYSLGDFFGDAQRAGAEYSVILDLEITKDNSTGQTRITGYSFTPIFTVTDGETLRVMRINETMAAYESGYIDRVSQTTYEAMAYALKRIQARILGE